MSAVTLINRLRRPTTTNHRIFRSAAIVGGVTIVVKIVATMKELAVANCFGRSDNLDSFLIAYVVPSFVVALLAGTFSVALIPTLIDVRERQGAEAAQRLFSNVIVFSQLLLLGVCVVVMLAAPSLVRIVGSGFTEAKVAVTVRLLYLLLPLIFINGLVSNLAAVLNAGEHFLLAAVTPMLTPCSALVFVIAAGHSRGIWAYAAGMVVGAVIEAALLARALHRQGISLRPRWYGLDKPTRQVCVQWAPLAAGALLVGGVGFVDQSMAAMLPSGSVAALSYGTRIVGVASTLASGSLSIAIVPYFSRMVAARDFDGCRRTLMVFRRLTLAFTLPLSVALIALSRMIVHTLYEHGAFSAADTALVSKVQALYAIQIPFFAVSILHVRLLSALKRNEILMYAAAINLSLDVVFNIICMRFWGVAGIALSTSLFYVVSCTFVVISASHALKSAEAFSEIPAAPCVALPVLGNNY